MNMKMRINSKNVTSNLQSAWKATDRYLNGSVNLKLVDHPAFRWGLIGLASLYLVVGGVVGWKVYKVKAESTNIRRILAVYPMPAVLMPQDVILVRDYLNQLKHIRHFAEKTKNPLPPDNELRSQLINQMIETRLLLHANRSHGIRVSKDDIDAAYKKIADANGGPQEVKKLLSDLYGMNEGEFRLLIRDQLLREKVRNDLLVRVQPKHILIRDEAKAKEVLEKVKKEPAKFDEFAKEFSEDTANRDKGGDLGLISRGVMVKPFEDAAFKLKKDEISPEVVKSDYGFHIIKVVDRRGEIDQSYQDFITDLRKKAKAWILMK